MADEHVPFILKMALRKSVRIVRGLRRHIDDRTEDVIVRKLLEQLDMAGWQITKIPGRSAGFTFDEP